MNQPKTHFHTKERETLCGIHFKGLPFYLTIEDEKITCGACRRIKNAHDSQPSMPVYIPANRRKRAKCAHQT